MEKGLEYVGSYLVFLSFITSWSGLAILLIRCVYDGVQV